MTIPRWTTASRKIAPYEICASTTPPGLLLPRQLSLNNPPWTSSLRTISPYEIQGLQHSGKTWKIRENSGKVKKSGKTWKIRGKSGKVKKSGKTWKTQGNFLKNKSSQGKLRENFYRSFQLVDNIIMFGS